MIIDFHTHAFPVELAVRAMTSITEKSGVPPCYDGTAESLAENTRKNGMEYSVVLNIATNEKQQQKVNDFAASLNNIKNLVGFGSVFPYSGTAHDELERIKNLGLKGIKLHPDYQQFFADDPALVSLYRHIGELGLITVFHAGYDMGIPEPVRCTPERIKKILPFFGGAPVVAAHFGGYAYWREAEDVLAGTHCYFDTSYTFGRIPFPQAKRILDKHGAEKILFGSDLPWSDAANEMDFIKNMRLSSQDTELILGGNAVRLLGL